jgi:hypothetical protein
VARPASNFKTGALRPSARRGCRWRRRTTTRAVLPVPISPVAGQRRERREAGRRSPYRRRPPKQRAQPKKGLIARSSETRSRERLDQSRCYRRATLAKEQRRGGDPDAAARRAWLGAKTQARSDPTHQQSAGCQPGTSAADLAPSAGRLRGFWGISKGFRRGFRRAPALPKNSRAGVSNLLKIHGPEI